MFYLIYLNNIANIIVIYRYLNSQKPEEASIQLFVQIKKLLVQIPPQPPISVSIWFNLLSFCSTVPSILATLSSRLTRLEA